MKYIVKKSLNNRVFASVRGVDSFDASAFVHTYF